MTRAGHDEDEGELGVFRRGAALLLSNTDDITMMRRMTTAVTDALAH